eukprot:1129912-Pelagomonas_calceolata.AAC.1
MGRGQQGSAVLQILHFCWSGALINKYTYSVNACRGTKVCSGKEESEEEQAASQGSRHVLLPVS